MSPNEKYICLGCKHNRYMRGGCDAFPLGIPQSILEDIIEKGHSTPFPEQKNKIVFEAGTPSDIVK